MLQLLFLTEGRITPLKQVGTIPSHTSGKDKAESLVRCAFNILTGKDAQTLLLPCQGLSPPIYQLRFQLLIPGLCC